MSDEEFNFLAARVGTGYTWQCSACMASGARIEAALKEVENRVATVEGRVNRIEDREKLTDSRLERLEAANKDHEAESAKTKEDVTAIILEELREREEKRMNVIIHGVREPPMDASTEDARDWDRNAFESIMAAINLPLSYGTSVLFSRRIGKQAPNRIRPLLVCMRKEADKMAALENAKLLIHTEYDKVNIVPDLTQKQREEDKKLRDLAARRNREELTEDDKSKNLRWVVLGKKGARRLAKLVSREEDHPGAQNKNKKNNKGQKRSRGQSGPTGTKKKTKRTTEREETSSDETEQEETEDETEETMETGPTPGTSKEQA